MMIQVKYLPESNLQTTQISDVVFLILLIYFILLGIYCENRTAHTKEHKNWIDRIKGVWMEKKRSIRMSIEHWMAIDVRV